MTYLVLFEGGEKAEPVPMVYGLVDPRTPDVVRYVGSTVCAAGRYSCHCSPFAIEGRRAKWTAQLRADGLKPTMVLLERVANECDLSDRERTWTVHLKADGQADLNARFQKRKPKVRTT